MVENGVETVDPRRGKRTDRAGGNGVDPCAFGAEPLGQIAHGCLKRRFGNTHDIVAREHLHRPVVTECQSGTVPSLHHRLGRFHDGEERVDTDVHGGGKTFTGSIEDRSLQLFLVRKGNRMDDNIDAVPDFAELAEDRSYLVIAGNVAGEYYRGINRLRQRPNPFLKGLSGVGYRQIGSLLMKKPGDRPGDTLVVGNTKNYGFFST